MASALHHGQVAIRLAPLVITQHRVIRQAMGYPYLRACTVVKQKPGAIGSIIEIHKLMGIAIATAIKGDLMQGQVQPVAGFSGQILRIGPMSPLTVGIRTLERREGNICLREFLDNCQIHRIEGRPAGNKIRAVIQQLALVFLPAGMNNRSFSQAPARTSRPMRQPAQES